MARTKAARDKDAFNSSGFLGVMRRGRAYGWSFSPRNGQSFTKSGYKTAEEAALAYDDFVAKNAPGRAETNQAMGYLKPRDVTRLRETLSKDDTKPNGQKNRKVGKSGFKGVSITANRAKPFKSQITLGGKNRTIGHYATAEEAARAYDAYVIETQGIDADTNLSRGLLPPLEEFVFDPRKKPGSAPDKPADEAKPQMHISAFLTPEQERINQIEAARLMALDEEKEEEEEPEPSTSSVTVIAPSVVATTSGDNKRKAPEPVAASPEPPPLAAPIPEPEQAAPVGVSEIADTDTQAILKTALAAMRKVTENREKEFRDKCSSALICLEERVNEYHKSLEIVIDKAAELDLAIAEFKQLLSS